MYRETSITPFKDKLYLSSPTMHGKELDYIKNAYDTNWMSTVGENIDEAEKLVSKRIGRKNAVAVINGTSALHLAVKIAGVKSGTKVFCSDLTFVASVNPVLYGSSLETVGKN